MEKLNYFKPQVYVIQVIEETSLLNYTAITKDPDPAPDPTGGQGNGDAPNPFGMPKAFFVNEEEEEE